ncbi:hypothetical protein KAI04_00750 [Candidatus Pacearchaeota archaeon]|nr:hypothetical protein [Candidatus Pacearchaeota archaeon]
MAVGVTLLIVAVLIIAVWIIIEVKRFKHKLFAIFLIFLILFTYLSFTAVLKGEEIDFKSPVGVKEAGTLYISWLGSIFGNLKTITTHAIDMDWKHINETSTS